MSSATEIMNQIWQDREIRFDVPPVSLEARKGEFTIDSMNSVEDTKGNNGERGELFITNLRMIWYAARSRRTNLSIGYNCIVSLNIKTAQSRLRGNTLALYVLTKYNGSRFEFSFTNLVRNSPRIFTTVQAVFRAYETTKLYRDLKLRGAIIRDKTLNLLPHEQVFKHVQGVWNLSSDQGNLGTFYITNVRMVWHANLAENFNVSIPYLQMKTIRMRDSKFGRALVVETVARSGGYILGFRVDPQDQLEGKTHSAHFPGPADLWRASACSCARDPHLSSCLQVCIRSSARYIKSPRSTRSSASTPSTAWWTRSRSRSRSRSRRSRSRSWSRSQKQSRCRSRSQKHSRSHGDLTTR